MIGIIMGSTSDLPVMQQAIDVLDELGLAYEVDIVSAHRTPEKLMDYGQNAHKRGIKAIIAGAGGAAHLPGMVASTSSASDALRASSVLPSLASTLRDLASNMLICLPA